MDQALATLEHEIRNLEEQAQHAERLAAAATDRNDANEKLRLSRSLRSTIYHLRIAVDRIRAAEKERETRPMPPAEIA